MQLLRNSENFHTREKERSDLASAIFPSKNRPAGRPAGVSQMVAHLGIRAYPKMRRLIKIRRLGQDEICIRIFWTHFYISVGASCQNATRRLHKLQKLIAISVFKMDVQNSAFQYFVHLAPSWAILAALGRSWLLLAAPGRSWFSWLWLLLGAPGCSWLLPVTPGCCWLLLGAPGRSWLLLGAPGCS